jgi:hypothetical protein
MSYDNLINTSLSVGPYLIDFFNQNELILKKNNYINKNIIGGDNRYNFSNIHITIDEKANDAEYVYNLYKDGLVDFANVPTKFIQNEINQNDTYAIDGTPVSLNMNTCNQEMWEYLFGENGSIVKTDKENYWDLKPAMSNTNFIKGLQLSINRIEMANNLNTTPTLSFFAKYFYYDLENSIPYIYTKYHNENIINYYGNENIVKNFGFDLIEARKYFKIAANELLNNNLYQENDVIEIEICWQNQDQVNTYGEYIKQYLETAFNHQSVCNNKLTLKVNNTYTEIWSDVFYKKMMCGQYDLCYGFFSFGTNNLVKFFDLFKSNNSSGMTLNWGIDTNSINYLIEYNNQYFTYDALWMIVDHGGYVNNLGAEAILYDAVLVSNVLNEDSTRTVTIKHDISKNNNTPLLYIDTIELYGVDNYETILIDNYTENNGIITFTLNNNIVNEFKGDIIINLFFKGYSDEDWNYYRKSINSKNNLSLN